MSMLEVGDDGALYVPPDLLVGAEPHLKYVLDKFGDTLILRPAEKAEPLWKTLDPAQRVEDFLKFAELPRPAAPDIPIELLDREHLYE